MSTRTLLLVCVYILHLSVLSAQQSPCQLKDGTGVGNCVMRRKCPSFQAQIRGKNATVKARLRNKYLCRGPKGEGYACCPAQSGPVQSVAQQQKRRLLPEGVCGRFLEEKILGGTTAGLEEFPWMALLQYSFPSGGTAFACGGSLISDRYVLTAAHCIKSAEMPGLVRLGEFDTSKDQDCQSDLCNPPPQDIKVEKVVVHSGYRAKDSAQYDDIALLRLAQKANLSTSVIPICLPLDEMAQKNYVGQDLVVAGWGRTSNERATRSDTKQKISLPVVTPEECSVYYNDNNIKLRRTQLCAGGLNEKDSCAGDSGGPLMGPDIVRGEVRWYITGIVSLGPSLCGMEHVAGIYTKVSEYTDWILHNMEE